MSSTIPALEIRRRLGKASWHAPRPFGPDGWMIDHKTRHGRVIVTASPAPDAADSTPDWWHASIAWKDSLPTYDDMVTLHSAVWPDGWAYQCFAPPSAHVNIHPNALHLWGKPDGSAALPNFGMYGTI